jgi:hypothetical protein
MRVTARHRNAGNALIELALALPVLLVLLLGVVDFSRAIQFDNVLVNLSREGANLASRTTERPQYIMSALSDTASPLQMDSHGMMYITRIVGRADGSGNVEAQFRATRGDTSLTSRIWSCGGWAGQGVCDVPVVRPIVRLPMDLRDGEVVYAVEAVYEYTPLTGYLLRSDPHMYAQTVL